MLLHRCRSVVYQTCTSPIFYINSKAFFQALAIGPLFDTILEVPSINSEQTHAATFLCQVFFRHDRPLYLQLSTIIAQSAFHLSMPPQSVGLPSHYAPNCHHNMFFFTVQRWVVFLSGKRHTHLTILTSVISNFESRTPT